MPWLFINTFAGGNSMYAQLLRATSALDGVYASDTP